MRPKATTAFAAALVSYAVLSPAMTTTAQATSSGETARAVRHIDLTRWSTDRAWRTGTAAGVVVQDGALRIGRPIGSRVYTDPYGDGHARHYDLGRWTSPWVSPGFGLTRLVPSWNAVGRSRTWLEIEVRGRNHSGVSSWDTMARWGAGDAQFHRTSLRAQPDDGSSVDVDTLVTNGRTRYTSWQLRVSLLRLAGTNASPTLSSIGAVASRLPGATTVAAGATSMRRTVDLPVPRYSQMIHRGDYPQYDGGGEAWCSPTSTSMVLGYYHRLPRPREYAWVDSAYPQPWVDYAARYTYDYRYQGTGNWPFNTAHAGTRGLDAYVTRLHSLREAEGYLKAGIPLVASISFGPGELDGAPITSTSGHLLVIRGFTARGDVIVNDPAARHARGVRRIYDRAQFANAWLPTTGGIVYVLRRPGTPVP